MSRIDTIIAVFNDIDEGKYTNATFSEEQVVICSKEHYDVLQDAYEELQGLKEWLATQKSS